MNKLQKQYEDVCNEYIKVFVKKHGYEFDYWIADQVGGIASFIEQYFFNLQDIVWDINSNQPEGLIFKWQDESLMHYPPKSINYYNYTKNRNEKRNG